MGSKYICTKLNKHNPEGKGIGCSNNLREEKNPTILCVAHVWVMVQFQIFLAKLLKKA